MSSHLYNVCYYSYYSTKKNITFGIKYHYHEKTYIIIATSSKHAIFYGL